MSVDALDLYQADRNVGRLFDERPLRFVYDDAWLGWPAAHAIAQFRVHRGGASPGPATSAADTWMQWPGSWASVPAMWLAWRRRW